MVKVFEILQTVSCVKMNIFQMKIFNEISLFLINNFIKFEVFVSLPDLAVRMYSNWPTDHAIDHSFIGLNRLTI